MSKGKVNTDRGRRPKSLFKSLAVLKEDHKGDSACQGEAFFGRLCVESGNYSDQAFLKISEGGEGGKSENSMHGAEGRRRES